MGAYLFTRPLILVWRVIEMSEEPAQVPTGVPYRGE